MILCLDVGNSHIFGGVFENDDLLLHFRKATQQSDTSDQLGVFLKHVLIENNIDIKNIEKIGISSVVPSINYSLRSACIKYFNLDPFILNHEINTNITFNVDNPAEVGPDLIAGSIAATNMYPNKNLLLVDLGTATTITAISSNQELLCVTISTGIRLSLEALTNKAAMLSPVAILKPKKIDARSTTECIQSGLYYGHLGGIKEIINRLTSKLFKNDPPIVIATGGYASIFAYEKVFDFIEPDLILHGIKLSLQIK